MVHHLLWRADAFRSLPAPNADLYGANPSASPLWNALLAFSDTATVSGWRRLTGWRGQPASKVRHLLHIHRLAFGSERSGKTRQADFFWKELLLLLRRLWPRTSQWEAAAAALGDPRAGDGAALRQLITTELLLDSHIAFANGYAAADLSQKARAQVHGAYIGQILDLESPPLADPATVLLPLARARASELSSRGRGEEAITVLKAFPACGFALVSTQLAELTFEATMAKLHDDPEGFELEDARILEQGIGDLGRLLASDPDSLVLYDLLSRLHHMRSVRLANGGEMPAALVASAKANAFGPGNVHASEAMKQLVDAMNSLMNHMEEVQKQMARSPGSQLNAEGLALQRQARSGFSLLERFKSSGEPQRIVAAQGIAAAAHAWRGIHDGALAERPSDGQLLALVDALVALLESDIGDAHGLAQAFVEMQQASPALPEVDASLVAAFVLRRRRQAQDEGSDSDVEPAASSPDSAPAYSIAPANPAGKDREPLLYWLAGAQDPGIRVLAAAAVACTVAVAVLSAIEMPSRHVRDEAVQAIRSARDGDDTESVIGAAERFLRARPLHMQDPRQAEVVDDYARAFTRWFVALENPGAEPARRRVATYQSLVSQ